MPSIAALAAPARLEYEEISPGMAMDRDRNGRWLQSESGPPPPQWLPGKYELPSFSLIVVAFASARP
jgi:hypothetical protein